MRRVHKTPMRLVAQVVVLSIMLLHSAGAGAEAEPTTGRDGLPGLVRVGTGGSLSPGLVVHMASGYGYTGAVVADSDTHHRALGQLAVGWKVERWLGLSLRFDGRYDKHSNLTGASDNDDGWVGDPRLAARIGHDLESGLKVGAQLDIWLPGADAPSLVASATSVDGRALASYSGKGSPLTVAAHGGFRLDNSAESIDSPQLLSTSDRMALGLSESNAVLLGAGASYDLGGPRLLAEWTWDVLIGSKAPAASDTPMRVTLGAQLPLNDSLALAAHADYRPTTIPSIGTMDALAPVEPKFAAMLGLQYTWQPPASSVASVQPPPMRITAPKPPPPKPVPARVSGAVVTAGYALSGATITVRVDGKEFTAKTDDAGRFEVADLPFGQATISVSRDAYKDATRTAELASESHQVLEFALEQALPPGQLRGQVKSFKGEAVEATLAINPAGVRLKTSDTGTFELDLPPGSYVVEIEAKNFQPQRRNIKIEQFGVTILNVDLRK